MKYNPETAVHTATPNIGQGNPVETKALTETLEQAGFKVVAHYPKGMWVRIGSEFHIRMSADTDTTMRYAQSSSEERASLKTLPLKFELKMFVRKLLKKYPEAQLFITPQNMLGEIATEVEFNGKKFAVIMILPDSMGKLPQKKEKLTSQQKKVKYLVWNENAYQVMTNSLGLSEVQLIDPIDPLDGFTQLDAEAITKLGLPEIFEEENLALIKLSGSGGDPKLINQAISALWENSQVNSVVFPGQKRTGKKLLTEVDTNKPVKQFYGEESFYNIARNMISEEQLLLTYPSEQFKHVMVLSKNEKQTRVVWLPPRGEHEVINLANFILLAAQDGITTTILMPDKYQNDLDTALSGFGFTKNLQYQYVEPENLSKEHFNPTPTWKETLPRTSVDQAIPNFS